MNIDFDKFDVRENIATFDRLVGWFKDGKLIKELTLPKLTEYPICPACLKWRGDIVEMSKIRKFPCVYKGKEDSFTKLQCPKCYGLDDNSGCTCGELRHRISCPMGFYLYFRYQILNYLV